MIDTRAIVARITRIRCQTLIAWGSDDRIIPINHGRRLVEALGDRVRFVEVPQAGHNDLLGRAVVWDQLAGFLSGKGEAS